MSEILNAACVSETNSWPFPDIWTGLSFLCLSMLTAKDMHESQAFALGWYVIIEIPRNFLHGRTLLFAILTAI